MSNYITVDGGTTNTRIILVKSGEIKATAKYNVGISKAIKDKELLVNTVKCGIEDILQKNGMCEKDIECILASGMITSEFGLCELAHLTVPCGIAELAKGMYKTVIESISPIPFVFIRGVKTECTSYENADMMRGEETELMGLCKEIGADSLYILPGSHSKHINTDSLGRITDFSTELTGELISAVASNTILSGIIDLSDSEICPEYLQKGYIYAKENGVNAAFFKVRILKIVFGCEERQIFGFFMGAALSQEIENIIRSTAQKVIIGGKMQLKAPMKQLLEANCDKDIITVADEITDNAAAFGAVRIYEYSLKEE